MILHTTPLATSQEALFDEILENLHIERQRESHLFIKSFNPENKKISEAISPDFYLPTQKLWVELSDVSRKSLAGRRKIVDLQTARQIIPFARIRLLCQEDTDYLQTLTTLTEIIDFLYYDRDAELPTLHDFRLQAPLEVPTRTYTQAIQSLVESWKEAKITRQFTLADELEITLLSKGWSVQGNGHSALVRPSFSFLDVTPQHKIQSFQDLNWFENHS